MRFTFTILAAVLALPAFGQWNRYGSSGKGEMGGIADPHPLAYFTREALVRDVDSGQVGCGYCTPVERAKMRAEGRTEISKVGKIGDYAVYDVLYYFDPSDATAGAKTILVQTGPNQFREIFYLGNTGWPSNPGKTRIVGDTPQDQMLWTGAGYGLMGMTVDYQLWVGDGMSVRMDFKAVAAAEAATMKSAGIARQQPWNRQMPLPTFESRGYALVSHLPAGDGYVDVTFTIDQGKAIVTGTSYTPAKRQ
jgi:hypothetical protein